MQTNSRVVSESLESYAAGLLAESAFFSALSAGEADPGHVRDVFGQYYLWRNRFHRWFGICVAKSAPVDDALNVPRVLTELIACLRHEIKGDHHRLALSFLAALAGRGLAGPGRDRIVTGALSRHYGVTSGLEFFSPLGEEEAKHSRAMWRAIIGGRRADTERLVEAARLEIWEHITFWDDVYYAILGMENEFAS